MVGDVFSLEQVQAAFPIDSLRGDIEFEWGILESAQIVERKGEDFRFPSPWMADVLYQRMLRKQRRKLEELVSLFSTRKAEQERERHVREYKHPLNLSGWVQVLKANARSKTLWKRRWLVLQGDKLIQYHDPRSRRKLEVVDLSTGAGVEVVDKGDDSFEFTVSAARWFKKGKRKSERRVFEVRAGMRCGAGCTHTRADRHAQSGRARAVGVRPAVSAAAHRIQSEAHAGQEPVSGGGSRARVS